MAAGYRPAAGIRMTRARSLVCSSLEIVLAFFSRSGFSIWSATL
jgi:hypothetical protein